MLLRYFECLRDHRVPVSTREWLDFLGLLDRGLAFADLDDFYGLSRLCLVKDERYYDRFDQAFAAFFAGQEAAPDLIELPAITQSLMTLLPQVLADIERDTIEDLLATLRAELQAQQDAQRELQAEDADTPHRDAGERREPTDRDERETPDGEQPPEDGDGDGGRHGQDGEGAEGDQGGEEPGEDGEEDEEGEKGERGERGDEGNEGEEGRGQDGRDGEGESDEGGGGLRDKPGAVSRQTARKLWTLREYQDLDPDVELGTRNIKMALRRLRRFTRSAAELELDLNDTIRSTARNGGLLDIKMIPERHNAIKVLLLLDVGGSMDEHVEVCAQLFSAARSEFKHLEFFYFHNFLYESLWTDNERRVDDRMPVNEVLRTFGADYKVIFVGDARMGRHEIEESGGSVEHYNAQPGKDWLARVRENFRKVIWLNPVAPVEWSLSPSISLTERLLEGEMYHLSPAGLEAAMKALAR